MSEPVTDPTEAGEAVDEWAADAAEADELVIDDGVEIEPYPGTDGPQDDGKEAADDGGSNSE